ncbi:MAG: glucosaminidase domain-containing protein [Bacteroidota bacterium]
MNKPNMNSITGLIGLFLLLTFGLNAQSAHATYINKYSDIAVREMQRTGIPASIKMAQSILESGGGTSQLSRKANNHFGIKCGSDWKGAKFYKKDDDRQNGRLINSCFRKYSNPEESFVAHSEFLKKDRYKALFKLKPTDYKGWAKGLQKAGYATSRTYSSKLIRLIEENKLYKLDSKDRPLPTRPPVEVEEEAEEELIAGILANNDIKAIKWDGQETIKAMAKRTNVSQRAIKKYNDIKKSTQLKSGQFIYLQPKRKRYRGKSKYHFVASNSETMYDISQKYGVWLEELYKKNQMRPGQEPAKGARVSLKKKLKDRPQLRGNEAPKPATKPATKPPVSRKPATKPSKKPEKPVNQKDERIIHNVQSGETLYSISRKYNVTVDQIKAWNKLDSNLIKVGQPLIVRP